MMKGEKFLVLPAALVVLLLAGCSEPQSSPRISERILLMAEPAERRILDAEDLGPGRSSKLVTWRLDRAPLTGWQYAGSVEPRVEGGLVVPGGAGFLQLARLVPDEYRGATRIGVVAQGQIAAVRCFWNAPGERSFSLERMVTVDSMKLTEGEEHLLDVGGHPAWDGVLGAVRCDFQAHPGAKAIIPEISLHDDVYDDPAELVEIVGQNRRIDIDSEVRTGRVVLPDLPFEADLEIPEASELVLSYGLARRASQAIEFRAEFLDGDSASHRLHTAQARTPGWRPLRIDLSDLAGRRGRLRLSTGAEDPRRVALSLPTWAEVEIAPRGTESSTARPEALNVVMISVDTLRADRLPIYGYDRQTAPHLTAWARSRGLTFRNTVAPSPWTLPSHVSLFSGQDALTHGVHDWGVPFPADLKFLAERLRDAGYHTRAWTGGGFLHPLHGLDRGFDRYRYWPLSPDTPEAEATGGELESHLRALVRDVPDLPEPFFAFFHTYEVHSPYVPRAPFYERFLRDGGLDVPADASLRVRKDGAPEESRFVAADRFVVRRPGRADQDLTEDLLPWVDALYDSGVAYTDHYLGRLFDTLDASGLTERTIVVLTSDHGEALGEKGLASHAHLYDFNLLVPLVIAVPGSPVAGGEHTRQVRLVDVTPTVLELLGLEVPEDLDGVSLAPALRGEPAKVPREAWSSASAYNNGVSLRTANRSKVIYQDTAWAPVYGKTEIYDLEADPREEENLAGVAPRGEAMVERILERLRRPTYGTYLRIRNGGPDPLTGRLVGYGPLHPQRVKAAGFPSPGLRWQSRGIADFELAPGEDGLVRIDHALPEQALRIHLDEIPGVRQGWVRQVTLGEVTGGWTVEWRDGAWSEGSGELTGTGFSLRYPDETGERPTAEDDMDAELEEQLRALGYVD